MSNKFILTPRVRQRTTNKHGEVIRITADAYNALVDMANEHTLSISEIASMAILFARDNRT